MGKPFEKEYVMGTNKCTHFEFFHHSLTTEYDDGGSKAMIADALVIPLTHPFILKVTGGDAEALTLANGVPGQTVTINLITDGGGDATITPATSTGFSTVVLADAGDQVEFGYVDDTVGWKINNCHGFSAPPVVA
jgi:hypothetical protein